MKSNTATGTTATAEPAAAARRGLAGRRGRFAPSPTGPLHLGSLLAAVGSYLDARAQGGEWLVRIEDVDRAREVPGAADDILWTLERFGLRWDGEVLRQSARADAYEAALSRLRAQRLTYECSCTRAEIAEAGAAAAVGLAPRRRRLALPVETREIRYTGVCRLGAQRPGGRLATRFRVEGFEPVTVNDRAQPPLVQDVEQGVGDFVLKRRDGFYAYQLAVVVDDADQGITDVVRGLDLYDNTPRQQLLQVALGVPTPTYLHLPLVVDRAGTKLSKSRRAVPADPAQAPALLAAILRWLGQPPPDMLRNAPVDVLLPWAISAWNPESIQGITTVNSTD